jgi:hypothetical protein
VSDSSNSGYSSPKEIGRTDADIVKRWTLELDLAEKAQKEWRKDVDFVLKRYRGFKRKKNSFNILWANTETLRQAVYNTLPKPDVRRRFRDDDPVAKVVSQVLERCADYAIDTYDFDGILKQDLMDMLLGGRGVSRVKYVPDLEDMDVDDSQETKDDDDGKEGSPAQQEPQQRLVYEAVVCDHVQWDDFRHGPGKTWDEVRWVAFRHRFSEIGGVEKFGEIFKDVPLDEVAEESVRKSGETARLFKSAEAWEIWDKDDKTVLFIAKEYKASPLQVEGDPLGLDGFFPIPRPLYAIEDPTSMEPVILFMQYKEQAEELDRITSRINNLTDALRHRGVYNKVLAEIEQLQDAGDNVLIPAKNVEALISSGGLEKHIWTMPIEQAANVIKVLMEQREACKAIIYEITGIADIMRGATDPNETKGAQVIKTTWGTQRLKKMQAEFQRYVRDIIRLKCQIIANKFQPETIMQMTGLKLAQTDAEKQQIKQQAEAFQQYQQQMAQQQAQQRSPMQPRGAPMGMQ